MKIVLDHNLSARFRSVIYTLCLAGLVTGFGACSSNNTPLPPPAVKKDYRISQRQLAPEPVYNRLRWVQLPSVIPAAKRGKSPLLLQVVSFNLENGTLEEAASMLAAATHYSTYCSSLIAKKTISFKGVGTVDNLAKEIANLAHISAVVDHNNREVRFTAQESPEVGQSRFSQDKVATYEYRSDHPGKLSLIHI